MVVSAHLREFGGSSTRRTSSPALVFSPCSASSAAATWHEVWFHPQQLLRRSELTSRMDRDATCTIISSVLRERGNCDRKGHRDEQIDEHGGTRHRCIHRFRAAAGQPLPRSAQRAQDRGVRDVRNAARRTRMAHGVGRAPTWQWRFKDYEYWLLIKYRYEEWLAISDRSRK